MKMSRIWNCFTKGLRVRPSAPAQSSQRKDDDSITSSCADHYDNSSVNKTAWLRLKECRNIETIVFHTSREGSWKRKNQNENDILHRIWDKFALSTATVLIVGRILSSKIIQRKAEPDKLQPHSIVSIKQVLGEKHGSDAHQSVIRDVLAKVSASNFPSHTAHAAGFEELNDRPVVVIKTVGGSQFDSFVLPDEAVSSAAKSVSFESSSASETSDTPPSKEEVVSEKDLDDFVQSTQCAVGMTYNVKGLAHMKAGEHKQAFKCFKLGSEEGSSKAQYNLALCYQLGKGTTVDEEKAVQYYKRAARQNHEWAQYNLALILLKDDNAIKVAHGLHLLNKAAEKGNVQAQSLLGYRLTLPGLHHNMKKAVQMFQMGTDNGHTLSTYHLAECYEHGLGGLKVDSSRAFQLYASAAEQGCLDAQFKMACILYRGCEDVDRNAELALEMLRESSSKGHGPSTERLRDIEEIEQRKRHETHKLARLFANWRVDGTIDLPSMIVPQLKDAVRRHRGTAAKLDNSFLLPPTGGESPNGTFPRVASWPSNLIHTTELVGSVPRR